MDNQVSANKQMANNVIEFFKKIHKITQKTTKLSIGLHKHRSASVTPRLRIPVCIYRFITCYSLVTYLYRLISVSARYKLIKQLCLHAALVLLELDDLSLFAYFIQILLNPDDLSLFLCLSLSLSFLFLYFFLSDDLCLFAYII